MEYYALDNAVEVNVSINVDAAVDAVATNAATVVFNVVSYVLNRAVRDTRMVAGEVSAIAGYVADKVSSDVDAVRQAGRDAAVATEDGLTEAYCGAKDAAIHAVNDAAIVRDAVVAATKAKVSLAWSSRVAWPVSQAYQRYVVAPRQGLHFAATNAIAWYCASPVAMLPPAL